MSKPPSQRSDKQIAERVKQVRDGDAAVTPSLGVELEQLFEQHRARVYALCLRMSGDPQRAEELTQETLAVAWERLDGFEGRARFSTWIHGIARNLCANNTRKRKELLTFDGLVQLDDPTAPVLAQLVAREREELLLASASAVLEPDEQEVVWLRYGEGMGQEQITRLLDLPGTGARGVLQRCRRKLGNEVRRRLAELGRGSSFVREP